MIFRQVAPPRFAGPVRGGTNGSADAHSTLLFGRSEMLRDAYESAAHAHAGQLRESDGSPFIEHPLSVARLLWRAGSGDDVVAAGLLHDTVEDSAVAIDDLRRCFGQPVADLVAAMTEPAGLRDFRTRKAAHRMQIDEAGCEAAAIFAADKVENVQNLRRALADQGESRLRGRLSQPLEQKLEHYRKTLELLDAMALPLTLASLLREELESFDVVRSRDGRVASQV